MDGIFALNYDHKVPTASTLLTARTCHYTWPILRSVDDIILHEVVSLEQNLLPGGL